MQLNPTITTPFDADSFQLIIDSSASSTATPCKSDFVQGMCQKLSGITISGIVSSLKVSDLGSVLCEIKDDDRNLIDF